ncbi:MAG TPA: hypothetical protein VL371_15450 [Gemmataceae bacterium]|nr:hypothetical protein [Gemmataceae bacterium]
MIRNSLIACGSALSILCMAATAADPRVETLRAEIRTLRAQEPIVLKAVHARYDLILKREKLTEAALQQQRHALRQEEQQLLAVAASEEQRAAVRTRYERLRKYVGGEIKLDEAEIKQVHLMRDAHVRQIRAAYQAKIKVMEAEMHALEKASHGKKK